MLIESEIISEIRVIIGDQADQFGDLADLKLRYALQDVLYDLTNIGVFQWNVRRASGLLQVNRTFDCPTQLAKVLYLSDSANNVNYFMAPYEEFHLREYHDDYRITYDESATIPFLIITDETTGLEQIQIAKTSDDLPTNLTYNLTYTKYTGEIVPWIPERLRQYIVSATAYRMLIKMDSPNADLVQYHAAIAKENLARETTFGANRSLIKFNQNLLISKNLTVDVQGKYAL